MSSVERYFPDRMRNFSLTFVCDKCKYLIETINEGYKDDVPEVCPKCLDGKMEYTIKSFQMFDTEKQKNWFKGKTTSQIADVLSNENINPY